MILASIRAPPRLAGPSKALPRSPSCPPVLPRHDPLVPEKVLQDGHRVDVDPVPKKGIKHFLEAQPVGLTPRHEFPAPGLVGGGPGLTPQVWTRNSRRV